MRIPRVFQPLSLAVGCTVVLNPACSHYLVSVLRLRSAANVIIFNGDGINYVGKLMLADKKQATVHIESAINAHTESPLATHLGQAIARGEKMDFVIQKTIELGVTEITPLFTERSEIKLSAERMDKRLQHWQGIAIAASEQCGRAKVATIHPPQSLTTWLTQTSADLKLILEPDAASTIQISEITPQSVAFVIGPEGGLTPNEIQQAIKFHFISWRLGPRILRTETAAMTALSALQYQWGDFNKC